MSDSTPSLHLLRGRPCRCLPSGTPSINFRGIWWSFIQISTRYRCNKAICVRITICNSSHTLEYGFVNVAVNYNTFHREGGRGGLAVGYTISLPMWLGHTPNLFIVKNISTFTYTIYWLAYINWFEHPITNLTTFIIFIAVAALLRSVYVIVVKLDRQ